MTVYNITNLQITCSCVTAIGFMLNCGMIVLLHNFNLSSRLTLTLLRIQSVADAASCFFSILACTTQHGMTGNFVVDWIFCRFWDSQLFYWIPVIVSTSNLVWMTVDRLWATVYAVTYKRNLCRYLIFCAVIGFLYIAFLIIPVVTLVDFGNGTCQPMSIVKTSAAFYSNYVHTYIWMVTYYFLPSILMVCVHVRVLLFMRRVNRRNGAADTEEQDRENRLLRPFTTCTVAFAIGLSLAHAYGTYYYVIKIENTLFYQPNTPDQLLSVFLTTLNCCVHPIILVSTLPQLRQEFTALAQQCVLLCNRNCIGSRYAVNPVT
ncbi:hypothetical protein FBUS_00821 [Fasciolopsis buskii]|uniref:G-protein coupled receptors family 1 profile domain-containing protein n=1 Tax=Fasciolopsis buskii TaxID=27845 RepID=A0A8E0RKE9_9TREM|nr:hypothetical protein FBUS_00821 [Fasciolopsis buski]